MMGNGRGTKVEGRGGSDSGDICVRGLAWVTREDGLRKYFEQFGKVGPACIVPYFLSLLCSDGRCSI
jgi:RNA recognition motif-containing protein